MQKSIKYWRRLKSLGSRFIRHLKKGVFALPSSPDKEEMRLLLANHKIQLYDLPDHVMGCEVYKPDKISARHIADLSVTDLYEAASTEFIKDSLEALQVALDAFYDANAHIQLPVPDWKIKVLLDWSGIEAQDAIA